MSRSAFVSVMSLSGLPRFCAGKHKVAIAALVRLHALEQRHRLRGQRHNMLAPCLHALGWNGPGGSVQVQFAPFASRTSPDRAAVSMTASSASRPMLSRARNARINSGNSA